MGLAGKLFRLEERVPLDLAAEKLRGWRAERVEEVAGEEYRLVEEVSELSFREDYLWGDYLEDRLVTLPQRDGVRRIVATRRTGFLLTEREGVTLLFVMERRIRAGRAASKIARILLMRPGGVFQVFIDPDDLRRLHESNPETTNVIYFDQSDFPNVDKMALYGKALADTSLYQEYLRHGRVWYVVFRDPEFNITVGIARNCVITTFSRVDESTFVDYVLKRLVPLAKLE